MLQPGRLLGNYRIDGVLGQGGMGVVYEATQLSLRRTVALKVIGSDVSADAAFRERFRLEGLIQAALDHPHIVTVFEAGEHERHLFIAMRLVRGPTLKDMIIARELDAGRALRILAPIADALDTAHTAGLIHRDVKPQNILVGPRDHAYLADFGLTKSAGQRGLTRTGQFVGSIDYIAPEQINGEDATPRTDVYALGAVLFEALTGIVPYPKASDAAVLYAHMSEAPPRVSEQRPELPVALDAVIAAAMAKAPEDRPSSAASLLRSAERAFSRRTRAAMQMPAPFENPEEAGVRPPERRVSTVESQRRADAPSPGAAAERTRSKPLPGVRTPTLVPGGAAARAGERRPPSAPAQPPAPGTVNDPSPRYARTPVVVDPRPRGSSRTAGPIWGWGAIAAILVIVALGAYAVARPGSSRGEVSAKPSTPADRSVSIVLPRGWRSQRTAAPLPGLRFRQPYLAAADAKRSGHGVIAGIVPDALGRDLIPASFSRRLGATARDGTPVRLGRLEGLRYAGLRIRGTTRLVTLYAVPTNAGAAVIACYAPLANPSPKLLDACAGSAATLAIPKGRAHPLAPDREYGRRLSAILTTLNRDRTAQRTRLGDARSRGTQASTATSLAVATSTAEAAATELSVSARDREAHDALVRALGASRRGYASMATAAKTEGSTSFGSAAVAVRAADTAIGDALAALATLGYTT